MYYSIELTVLDPGARVKRLLLRLPRSVPAEDVNAEKFHVSVCITNPQGETMKLVVNHFTGEYVESLGDRIVLDAYPCTQGGARAAVGAVIALELDPNDVLSTAVVGHDFLNCSYQITMTEPIGSLPAMKFDALENTVCPDAEGWQNGQSQYSAMKLQYGFFTPEPTGEPLPLIIWLHGAGEGGYDPRVAYMGNRVTALSSQKVQSYFGNAWVLAPQAPTMWMDDGSGEYGRSGKSMYTKALKALIDEFLAEHEVDRNRIYIGGCSNGGFMTMRMLIDFPGFFAAAFPMCEALYDETISENDINTLCDTPIWFLHAMTDGLVPPVETSLPTYQRLKKAGAKNVHFTYIDDRAPAKMVNHGCWVQGLRDEECYDFDGQSVLIDEKPVTRFQWLARQSLA